MEIRQLVKMWLPPDDDWHMNATGGCLIYAKKLGDGLRYFCREFGGFINPLDGFATPGEAAKTRMEYELQRRGLSAQTSRKADAVGSVPQVDIPAKQALEV